MRIYFVDCLHPYAKPAWAWEARVREISLVETSEEVRVGLGLYYKVVVEEISGLRVADKEIGPYTWRDRGQEPRIGQRCWVVAK